MARIAGINIPEHKHAESLSKRSMALVPHVRKAFVRCWCCRKYKNRRADEATLMLQTKWLNSPLKVIYAVKSLRASNV